MKKMGRPTDNPKPYKITVRLDMESKAILDAYCKKNEVNQMEAVRRAIKYLSKDGLKVGAGTNPLLQHGNRVY